MITVLLGDAHRLILDGLSGALRAEPDMEIVGVAQSGDAALKIHAQEKPDVTLIDIHMPDANESQLICCMKSVHPDGKIVVLADDQDERLVLDVIRWGAHGFLLKDSSAVGIVTAIRKAHQGEFVLAREVVTSVVNALRDRLDFHGEGDHGPAGAQASSLYSLLSERERDVLPLIAHGLTNRDIASILHVTEGTIKNHVSSIVRKLHLRSRTEIAAFAWKHGLVGYYPEHARVE